MPKLITVHRHEEITHQARNYVKSYLLFPAGLIGLVSMIGGVGALGYQLLTTDSYTWGTFYQSSALIVLGAIMGIAQTRYHQYLLKKFPETFAARMRQAAIKKSRKAPADLAAGRIDHPGRRLVPLVYLAGGALLVSASAWCGLVGQVNGPAAVLMPWAGFYWARLFFWRSVVS